MSDHSAIPSAVPFRTARPLSAGTTLVLAILVLIGAAAFALGVLGDEPAHAWEALLFNWLFWSSLSIGMVMFAVALHITQAQWAWSVRRFALAGVAFLPISYLLLLVVFFGYEHYFHHWLHAAGDPVIDAKRAWLNLPGLVTRDLIAVAVLFILAGLFARYNLRPDVYGAGSHSQKAWYDRLGLTKNWRGAREEALRSKHLLNRIAPVLGIVYALVWGMTAIDLAMSLVPHWFSTMFPVAFFWTAFHGGVAATIVAVVALRSPMRLEPFITLRQFHDLGKLLFAFAVFWMYLNWSQYIVIWYGLLPWEQEFFVNRFSGGYAPIAQAVVLLVFVIPFFGLLTRPPKMVPAILAFFAVLILTGHWLERFMLIAPSLREADHFPIGLIEIGIALGFLGLFVAAYGWFVRTFPVLPSPVSMAVQDPAVISVREPASV